MYFSIIIYFKKLFYPNIEQDIDYNTETNENKYNKNYYCSFYQVKQKFHYFTKITKIGDFFF